MNRPEQRIFVGWVAMFLALWGASPAVCAQTSREPAVYLYQGADREQRLSSGAKQEGVVSIYTSMQLPDSLPLTQAFERKSGLKVSLWRASGEKVVQRALAEARAGRFDVDVLETDGAQMEILYREKQLPPLRSPSFEDTPPNIGPSHRHYL